MVKNTMLQALVALLSLTGTLAYLQAPFKGRHTLNVGPILSHAKHVTAANGLSDELTAFNALLLSQPSFLATGEPMEIEEAGLIVAREFVKALHPQAEYVVDSHYLSEHNWVHHVHLVQAIRGIRVANALININIDFASNQILSYGDSFWRGYPQAAQTDNKQFVFSPNQRSDGATYMLDDPYSSEKTLIDPRIALRSFLQVGNPSISANLMTDDHWQSNVIPSQFFHRSESGISTEIMNVPGALEPVPANLRYIQTENGGLELAWQFNYKAENNWYEAHVKAACANCNNEEEMAGQAELLMAVDWQKDYRSDNTPNHAPNLDSTQVPLHFGEEEEQSNDKPNKSDKKEHIPQYRLFPWGVNDPSEGPREVMVNPSDKVASPAGWHNIPQSRRISHHAQIEKGWERNSGWSSALQRGAAVNFTDTRGNNVFAQDNPSGGSEFELNYRPSAPDLNFTFPLHWGCRENCTGKVIPPKQYLNVSITQLFYTVNMFHDLTYRYGFDEASGNFQERNFGDKGLENDGIIAMAADGSGMNNANFATPPDGQRGRMRMYIWNTGELPMRDGDLEEGIVIHEAAHGLSTRLTGGPMNSGCLAWGEAGGMGEGWGDCRFTKLPDRNLSVTDIATLVRMHKKKVQDWSMGSWAANRATGIRKYPYSLNDTTNPESYKSVDRMFEVHSIGAVWAEVLFVVTESLIKELGFSHELFPPMPLSGNSTEANIASHADFYKTSAITGKKYPAHGNTLSLQLVIDGMKLQPCRPDFLDARDAIIAADHALTGGENLCTLYEGFSKKGLGVGASVRGKTPFGGGFRTESKQLPAKCHSKKH